MYAPKHIIMCSHKRQFYKHSLCRIIKHLTISYLFPVRPPHVRWLGQPTCSPCDRHTSAGWVNLLVPRATATRPLAGSTYLFPVRPPHVRWLGQPTCSPCDRHTSAGWVNLFFRPALLFALFLNMNKSFGCSWHTSLTTESQPAVSTAIVI